MRPNPVVFLKHESASRGVQEVVATPVPASLPLAA